MLSVVETDKAPQSVVFGLSGGQLSKDERAFFSQADPLGFILFARNCHDPGQLSALTADLNDCLGRKAPVLIDQEGGRVQRLQPPHWGSYPPAAKYGSLFLDDFEKGMAGLKNDAKLMARELAGHGINVNCAPVLDVHYPETDHDIGNRSFSNDPEVVAVLGAAVCDMFLRNGVVPVVKHMPGLGRATENSHETLPVIDCSRGQLMRSDLEPYVRLSNKPFSGAIWGMVAHAVYRDIDPELPASCSRDVIFDLIRETVGFDGLLLSDDVSMGALDFLGDAPARTDMVLRGGCDIVLHCNGDMKDMEKVAGKTEKMTKQAVMRYNRTVEWITGKHEYRDTKAV